MCSFSDVKRKSLSRREVYIMDRGGVVIVLERIVSGGDKVVLSTSEYSNINAKLLAIGT